MATQYFWNYVTLYIYVCPCMCVCVYMCMWDEREKERENNFNFRPQICKYIIWYFAESKIYIYLAFLMLQNSEVNLKYLII